jgi:hypothetical protein
VVQAVVVWISLKTILYQLPKANTVISEFSAWSPPKPAWSQGPIGPAKLHGYLNTLIDLVPDLPRVLLSTSSPCDGRYQSSIAGIAPKREQALPVHELRLSTRQNHSTLSINHQSLHHHPQLYSDTKICIVLLSNLPGEPSTTQV